MDTSNNSKESLEQKYHTFKVDDASEFESAEMEDIGTIIDADNTFIGPADKVLYQCSDENQTTAAPSDMPHECASNDNTTVKKKGVRRKNYSALHSAKKRYKTKRYRPVTVASFLAVLLSLGIASYGVFSYSNISFIKELRSIYIETALATMEHQWLATKLLPYDVVSATMKEIAANKDIQNALTISNIHLEEIAEPDESDDTPLDESPQLSSKEMFISKYSVINPDTLPDYLDYTNLDISDIESLGIETIHGDKVWAINDTEGILIISLSGDGYVGKLSIIKDSSRVGLVTTSLPNSGQNVHDMVCEDSDIVMAINAGGFSDPAGHGNGGTPVGLVISDGETLHDSSTSYTNSKIAAFDTANNFIVGNTKHLSELPYPIRDAVEFYPILIFNGEEMVEGSYGHGIHPRTVIGQTLEKDILLLAIDGRQVGYSIGTTLGECTDILLKYNAYNAINMDGGSSTQLYYNGETINKVSSVKPNGRRVANAWAVYSIASGRPVNTLSIGDNFSSFEYSTTYITNYLAEHNDTHIHNKILNNSIE